MMAHGYTITASCDGDGHILPVTFDGFGHTKREAFADMRKRGWTWKDYNCWCSKCSKLRRSSSEPRGKN